jgi:hypothetical protein
MGWRPIDLPIQLGDMPSRRFSGSFHVSILSAIRLPEGFRGPRIGVLLWYTSSKEPRFPSWMVGDVSIQRGPTQALIQFLT